MCCLYSPHCTALVSFNTKIDYFVLLISSDSNTRISQPIPRSSATGIILSYHVIVVSYSSLIMYK